MAKRRKVSESEPAEELSRLLDVRIDAEIRKRSEDLLRALQRGVALDPLKKGKRPADGEPAKGQ